MAEMRFDNARDPEQLRRMQELADRGECHFCGDVSKKHTAPIIYNQPRWFIVANNFPYEGAIHHYLIVSQKHYTRLTDLPIESQIDLFRAIRFLERHLSVSGESIFVRSGEMAYTGATLDHLHFHFLVGAPKPEDAKFPEDNILVTLGFKNKK